MSPIRFELHVFHHFGDSAASPLQHSLNLILEKVTTIMTTATEASAKLDLVLASQAKTRTEIADLQTKSDAQTTNIQELKDIIAALQAGGTDIPQELADKVDQVFDGQQAIDAAIPDLPAPPTA